MIARILSGSIAALYVILAYAGDGGATALKMFIFCLLPLFCIWWSEPMGAWTGSRIDAPSFTGESPGCIVQLLGWVLLLVPIVAGVIIKLRA